MPADNPITTLRTDKGKGIDKHRAELNAWANQVNAVLAGAAGDEDVEFSANYIGLNHGYTTVGAQSGGLVVNYLPTATADTTVGYGVVTPGVVGVSNPKITTLGATTFADTHMVMISGSDNDGENDGLYEVSTHAGHVLTLRSTAHGFGANQVEAFTRDQLVANAGDVGMTITRVGVSVLRTGTNGLWEQGFGNTTPLTFADVLNVNGVGSLLTITDAAAYWTAADTLQAMADALVLQIGGLTDATFGFTEDNVVADDDPIYLAIDKLDRFVDRNVGDEGCVPAWQMPITVAATVGDTFTIGADVYEYVAAGGNISNDAFVGILRTGVAATPPAPMEMSLTTPAFSVKFSTRQTAEISSS